MINQYLKRHEDFLQQIINNYIIPAPNLDAAISYCLFPGGKRIRPILVYLTGDLLHINQNILDVIAAAIELTHCYSLIHDDLPAMDNDDFRRGRLSCHKAFDEATAILAGDGLQSLAIEVLLTHLSLLLPSSQVVAITLELVKASGIQGMVSGQSLDLSELKQSSMSEQRLREIHSLKTGKLILACIEMVLKAHPNPTAYEDALRKYANHLGIVFQMQDDYLDYYAPQLLGKDRTSDIANKKMTFASLYNQSQLNDEIRKQYQIAMDALTIFDEQGLPLIHFTKELQERGMASS